MASPVRAIVQGAELRQESNIRQSNDLDAGFSRIRNNDTAKCLI
jgi:hypothetical protein